MRFLREDQTLNKVERIKQAPAAPGVSPMPFQAAATGVQAIRANGTPFSAIVILSARPVTST